MSAHNAFVFLIEKGKIISGIKMTDLDFKGKRVLIRCALNIPVKDGNEESLVSSDFTRPTRFYLPSSFD